MKIITSRNLFLVLCSFFLIFFIETKVDATEPQPTLFHSYLRQGIDKAFNLETADAYACIKKAVELEPENPTGYSYLAVLHWFSSEMSFDIKDRDVNQEAMLSYVKESLARGEKRIKNNPQDNQVYFAMALAKIVKIRWAINQKHYFVLAQETSNIWDYLEKAKGGNGNQNYDTYFLMGLFHYHLKHVSGIIRFLSSAFFIPGGHQKGLQELELAAKKGDLLKELAQAELSSNYLNFEKQPAKALPFARELNKRFPNNYNFLFTLSSTLADLHRFEEASDIARQIEKNIQTGVHPFVPQLQPRYNQLMGRILFNQEEYDRSIEYFQNALKDTSLYNARVRVWAFVRLGMIQDIRKQRNLAEEYYSKALEVEGGEGAARIEAKKYLLTPYTPPAKL
jgi:tetratricopeptide (TPR) repeat protein